MNKEKRTGYAEQVESMISVPGILVELTECYESSDGQIRMVFEADMNGQRYYKGIEAHPSELTERMLPQFVRSVEHGFKSILNRQTSE